MSLLNQKRPAAAVVELPVRRHRLRIDQRAPARPDRLRLESILAATALRISERGTGAEPVALRAMSEATACLSPGASAALVDSSGSESARLRAFGIVHGIILRDLDVRDRSRLLARLTDAERPGTRSVTAVESPCQASRQKSSSAGPGCSAITPSSWVQRVIAT